jgi:hypothetical protein
MSSWMKDRLDDAGARDMGVECLRFRSKKGESQ